MSFVFIHLRVCHTDMLISGTALLSLNVSRNLNLCQEQVLFTTFIKDKPTHLCVSNVREIQNLMIEHLSVNTSLSAYYPHGYKVLY